MIRGLNSMLAATAILAGGFLASAQESSRWIFEGQLTRVDPVLAPDLQSGWVLAGSFLFAPMEMEEEPVGGPVRSGRLAGGISEAELTVDLYYQLHFEAYQAAGLAGVDYRDDDPEQDGRDIFGWFIPVNGELGDTGWSARWLQLWLADPEGRMIRGLPPRFSPHGFDWQAGWFRLTFVNESGETALAEGHLEVFAPAGDLSDEEEEKRWRGVAAELSALLEERDASILKLREELARAHERLSGLQQLVDLMVSERAHLKEENIQLRDQAALADPAVAEAMAGLTAEKALLLEQVEDLRVQSRRLESLLSESEKDRRILRERLQEFQEREILAAAAGHTEMEAGRQMEPDPEPDASLAKQPIEPGPGAALPPPERTGKATPDPRSVGPVVPAPVREDKVTLRQRRFGPRKFR